MLITTAYDPDSQMESRAIIISEKINEPYIKRNKYSLKYLMNKYNTEELIIVEKDKAKYFSKFMDQPFFFHPSMAVLRINRLKQGDNDLMIKIAELKPGDNFLDCTFGLGSDSIVASFAVGPGGRVVGFESQPALAAIVQDGLKLGWEKDKNLEIAMKQIEVINEDHLTGLKKIPDKSFDVIYFDPMFRKGIEASSSINPLRALANNNPVTEETIAEAKRVARRKIILKEHIHSQEFKRLGFSPFSRQSAITYGVIEI